MIATKSGEDPAVPDAQVIDRIQVPKNKPLAWYSEDTHRAAFVQPPAVLQMLASHPVPSMKELSASINDFDLNYP